MVLGLAAATSALDLVKTLTQAGSSSKSASDAKFSAGASTSSSAATSTSGNGQTSLISPDTMNALFAAQGQSGTASSTSRSDALRSLFSQIDGNGDGQITKSEFEGALGAGGTNTANADKVFGDLDADGDGSVSLGELASALKGKHRGHGPKRPNENADALLQALDAASTAGDTTNATAATPAAASASSTATRSYSAIEQMIQRQAELLTKTRVSSSLSVSV